MERKNAPGANERFKRSLKRVLRLPKQFLQPIDCGNSQLGSKIYHFYMSTVHLSMSCLVPTSLRSLQLVVADPVTLTRTRSRRHFGLGDLTVAFLLLLHHHCYQKLAILRRSNFTKPVMVLPTSSSPNYSVEDGLTGRNSGFKIPIIFRRLHRFQQMVRTATSFDWIPLLTACQDFELAAWQLTYLCLAPRRVYASMWCSQLKPF